MNDRVAELVRRNVLRTEAAAPQGAPAMLEKARMFLDAAGAELDSAPSVALANSYT